MRRIALVSYLDTVPFAYGIGHAENLRAELLSSSAAECVDAVTEGRADMALIPAALACNLKNTRILTSYCIASNAAGCVRMSSDVPLQRISRIVYDADTLVTEQVLRILSARLWRISPEIVERHTLPADWIPSETDAEASAQPAARRYSFDVDGEWRRLTRTPLVLGVWVVRTDVTPEQSDALERALTFGIEHVWEALAEHGRGQCTESYMRLTEKIDYLYDEEKDKALKKLWSEGIKVSPRANPG